MLARARLFEGVRRGEYSCSAGCLESGDSDGETTALLATIHNCMNQGRVASFFKGRGLYHFAEA